MYADRIEGHKALVAGANKQIADDEAEKAKVVNDAAMAKERLAKIERGEDVKGGFGKAPCPQFLMRQSLGTSRWWLKVKSTRRCVITRQARARAAFSEG